jgi:phosphoserine phosphatase RsbU/P
MSSIHSEYEIEEALRSLDEHRAAVDEAKAQIKQPSLIDRAIGGIERLFDELTDRESLSTRVVQLETENALLRQRDTLISRQMARHDEEQRLAARIQQDFLPKTLPVVGMVSFQTAYRPAHYVSGDLFDVKRLDEQHVGVYLADAVGHGTPAALLTMFMKNALVTKRIRKDGYELVDPAETLALLNSALLNQDLQQSSFATAVYARINCVTGDVVMAKAGHPEPIIIGIDGTTREIAGDGPLLGVFPEAEWNTVRFTLQPGERLILYTDGVETAFPVNDQPCSQTWKRELDAMTREPSEEIIRRFREAIENNPLNGQKDDLTLVIAETRQAA